MSLLLTLFLTPLLFSPVFVRVFAVPKTYFFQIGTMLAMAFFLLSLLFCYNFTFSYLKTRQKIFLSLGFFLLLSLVISTNFAELPAISLWGGYFRIQGLISFIHYFAFGALCFIYVQQEENNYAKILLTLISSATIASVYGLIQGFNSDFISWQNEELMGRIFGTMSNPNSLALLLSISIPLTLSVFVAYKWRWLSFSSFLIQFAALFLTQSRGSIIGLTAGIICFFVFTSKAHWKKGLLKAILILSFVALAGIGTINFFPESPIIKNTPLLNRLVYNFENIRSLKVRSVLWSSSYQLALKKPLTGFGADSFQYIYGKNRANELNSLENSNYITDRTHNEFLDILIFFGWPSFLLYMSTLISFFYCLHIFIKKHRTFKNVALSIGIFSALISYLITIFFSFSLTTHFMMFASVLGGGLGFVCFCQSDKKSELYLRVGKTKGYIGVLLVVFLAFTMITEVYLPPIKADLIHAQALKLLKDPEKNKEEILEKLETAASIMPMYTDYAKIYAVIVIDFLKDEKKSEDVRSYLKHSAEEVLFQARQNIPIDSNILLYSGLLEGLVASQEKSESRLNSALWFFKEALNLSPNDPNIYLKLGDVYYENAKFGSAIEQYQKFLLMMPNYWRWPKEKGDEDLDDKEKDQLKRIFLKQHQDFYQTLINLSRSYTSIGSFEKALYYLDFVDENEFEKYVVQGDVYKFGDKFANAIKAYKKALELSPENPVIIRALEDAQKRYEEQ